MERRLTAILVADMVGYSRLMAADEAGTLARHAKRQAGQTGVGGFHGVWVPRPS